ncbi:MFS transporter [Nocardioides humi]|uniref:MFS transporter n=1 Tax=Nocardioides humi TaxID=449461 RepID=A0ABN2BU94_9ACTN|nr:MFS transporter [Nocardioides humi]
MQRRTDGDSAPGGTFVVLALGVTAFALLQTLIVPVLPLLRERFGVSQSSIAWLVTANLLAAAVATPLSGRVGDRVGKHRVLVGSLVLLTAGSLLAAVAPGFHVLVAARVLQGLGAGITPMTYAIARDEFAADAVATLTGVLAALVAVGGGIGVVLAGPLEQLLGIRSLFWVPGAVLAVLVVASVRVVPPSPVRSETPVNPASALLLGTWLVTLLLALTQGQAWGWLSPGLLGTAALCALTFGTWIRVERRTASPTLDLGLMSMPVVALLNLVAFLVGIEMFASLTLMPLYFQAAPAGGYGFGSTTTEAGLLILPSGFTMFVFGALAARFSRLFGNRSVLWWGCSACAAAMLLLALIGTGEGWAYLATGVLGAGHGLVFATVASHLTLSVPQAQTGVAGGMNINLRQIGGALGITVTSALLAASATSAGDASEAAFRGCFVLLAGVVLLAVPAVGMLPGPRPAR